MKKMLALLMALSMTTAVALTSCGGDTGTSSTDTKDETVSTESSAEASEETTATTGGQIIIGSVSDVDADMFPGWTASAENQAIWRLLYGYSTVDLTQDALYEYDPQVVVSHEEIENEDGSKTFKMTIADDLVWSDGTPITATDYAFAIMLTSSKQYGELEADNTSYSDYVGWDEWHEGTSNTFTGVNVIDEHTFSVTVKADRLPYHYENTYASVSPYPMFMLAPDCEITSDGTTGCTMSDGFTTELLSQTIADTETGYRYNPTVVSGQYTFTSYDASNYEAVLTLNDKFKGQWEEAYKPSIEKIVIKKVNAATAMDELAAGTIDLYAGVSGGTEINKGLDLYDQGKVSYANWSRAGYGKLQFHCDVGPTDSTAVRQAVSYILDKNEFAKQYTGGYGKLVYGAYGLSQSEYKANKEAVETELNKYEYNLDTAKEVLIADGWTLNANGGEFVEGTDDIRYKKMEDGSLQPLIIKWACTPDNPVVDLLNTMLVPNAPLVGMKIEPTVMDFNQMLTELQMPGSEYNMFNLATGYYPIIQPWYSYSMDEDYMGLNNSNIIRDEELARVTEEMRYIVDEDEWNAKWLEYQIRFNELCLDIPLYSDIYHAFFTPKLQNYHPDALHQWDQTLLYAYIDENATEVTATQGE
ncbi:MAG: ABC transporter substrate-binding protein [Candidatus Merdivicinus sp.]|jgi:peptide/nickel transport system substrate-binding protein